MLIRSSRLTSRRGILAYPRATISDVTSRFEGAFKTSFGQFGGGSIAVQPGTSNMFLESSRGDDFPVGRITIPALVNETSDLGALNTAAVQESPVSLFDKIPTKEWAKYAEDPAQPEAAYIWGMYHDGTKLYVNGAMEYDASESGTDTTFRVEDPTDLANTAVVGAFKMSSKHFGTKCFADIPDYMQPYLGGDLLSCSGTALSIVGRQSKGPSLYVCNKSAIASATTQATVAQLELMAWKSSWINPDYLNYGGACGRTNNDLWVVFSGIGIGFIIPGTRTLCYIGTSAGHNPGPLNYNQANVGSYTAEEPGQPCSNPYAGTRSENGLNDGTLNGTLAYKDGGAAFTDNLGRAFNGYFPWDASDQGPYYWLFDIDKIINAPSITAPRPYAVGKFPAPFANPITDAADGKADEVGGSAWDPVAQKLYLSLPNANNDSAPGEQGNPVVAVYDFS